MMITLATVDYGNACYEALYVDGRLAQDAADEKFSASDILEFVALFNDISVSVAYVDVDQDFDQEVIADDGWPDALADVKVAGS